MERNIPIVIPRSEHPISRAQLSSSALKVLNRLKESGYAGLLVGGCVRDLMLGREPKDFDVVTDARPEEIRSLFRNAILIGRRFRLAHVRFGREVVEVATFRAGPQATMSNGSDRRQTEQGRIIRDNIFGTQEEDARRRDFTVNALYYDIRDFSVVDYVEGVADLEQGILRMIGDPETRYREDPVRMLRAARFAAKLGFRIAPETEAPIRELAHLLEDVPAARMFEEVLKLFYGGCAVETFELLRHYDLFRYLFPLTEQSLATEKDGFPRELLPRALANTDQRIHAGKPVTPAFLYAVMLWHPAQLEVEHHMAKGLPPGEALRLATQTVLRKQVAYTIIPRRFSGSTREIWSLQSRFLRRSGKQVFRLMSHPRFRAAYDFLLLRAETGEVDTELAQWWTRIQEVSGAEQQAMLRPFALPRKRRQSGRRHPPPGRA